jgi:hypothetical protein
MQYAEVFRSVAEKHFVILTKKTPKNVEFIISTGDVDIKVVPVLMFTSQYVQSNTNPAHAAKTWLSGHKRISDRARALLDIISQTEYTMPPEATPQAAKGKKAPKAPAEAAAAAAAAKANGPDKTSKVTGEAKVPKAPKAPKLDADGNPIVKVAKKVVWDRPKFSNTAKFTKVADPNPRRPNTKSYEWFEIYKKGQTVEEALKLGAPRADISWCIHLGYLTLDKLNEKTVPADKK